MAGKCKEGTPKEIKAQVANLSFYVNNSESVDALS